MVNRTVVPWASRSPSLQSEVAVNVQTGLTWTRFWYSGGETVNFRTAFGAVAPVAATQTCPCAATPLAGFAVVIVVWTIRVGVTGSVATVAVVSSGVGSAPALPGASMFAASRTQRATMIGRRWRRFLIVSCSRPHL